MLRTRILGTGRAVGSRVLSNTDLDTTVDTSDAWIRERTGIKERRILEPGRSTSDLAVEAGRAACANAHIEPDGGASATTAVRRIGLGQSLPSGRGFLDLEDVISGAPPSPSTTQHQHNDPESPPVSTPPGSAQMSDAVPELIRFAVEHGTPGALRRELSAVALNLQ